MIAAKSICQSLPKMPPSFFLTTLSANELPAGLHWSRHAAVAILCRRDANTNCCNNVIVCPISCKAVGWASCADVLILVSAIADAARRIDSGYLANIDLSGLSDSVDILDRLTITEAGELYSSSARASPPSPYH
jgi:hypothetical protein